MSLTPEISNTTNFDIVKQSDNTVITNKDTPELNEFETHIMTYISLLHPDDKLFLNFKNIYTQGNQYFKNYNSDAFTTYKRERELIINNYTTKKDKFYLDISNEEIKVFKIKDSKVKEDLYQLSNLTLITSLKKPEIINHLDIELDKIEKHIQQTRYKLQYQYQRLVNDIHLDPLTKEKFIKQRNIFSKKLNDYYTKLFYFNKINKILTNNENILLNKLISYFPENASNPIPRLSTKNINIKPETISQLNEIESQNLNNYYQVLQNLKRGDLTDKELKDSIKEYLNGKKKNTKDIDKVISTKINKKTITTLIL